MPSFSWVGLKAFWWLHESETTVPRTNSLWERTERKGCLWICSVSMKAGDEVGLGNQSPIQPSSREHVCSLRGIEVLECGLNKIIVCWTACLEKRNYFRSSLFSFNHVITQNNLQTCWKWGLETNRSFEKQVVLGLSVMELQLVAY